MQGAHPVALVTVAVSSVGHCARAMVHVVSCGRQQAAACSRAGSCAHLLVIGNLVQRRCVVCKAGGISRSGFVNSDKGIGNCQLHVYCRPLQRCPLQGCSLLLGNISCDE